MKEKINEENKISSRMIKANTLYLSVNNNVNSNSNNNSNSNKNNNKNMN
jgi:hypothetical protein